jgi:hypothetical protein
MTGYSSTFPVLTAAPPDRADAGYFPHLGFGQFRGARGDWGAAIACAAGLPGIRGLSHERHFSGSSDTEAGLMPVADRGAGVLAFRRS